GARGCTFASRPRSASLAAVARSAPAPAATEAAMSPSTRGALVSRTRAARSGSRNSRAISAESTAEPRSRSTSTPSPASALPIASDTATASVPKVCSSRPAATSMTGRPSGSPSDISEARATAASARARLWLTTTMPIIEGSWPAGSCQRACRGLQQQRGAGGAGVDVSPAALAQVAGPSLAGDQALGLVAALGGCLGRRLERLLQATAGADRRVERVQRGRERVIHRLVAGLRLPACHDALDTGAQRPADLLGPRVLDAREGTRHTQEERPVEGSARPADVADQAHPDLLEVGVDRGELLVVHQPRGARHPAVHVDAVVGVADG